ncbi:MAG: kelch repeat-containing protein, partial [Candidatus Udaeobacter sp.]
MKKRINPSAKAHLQSACFRPRTWICLLLVCAAVSVHADIITVTNTNDSGPGSLHQALDEVYRLTGNILFFPTPTPTATGTPTPTPTCIPGGTPGPWTEAAVYPAAVYGAAVASDGANIYAFGGNTVGGAQHAEAYRYDPIANTWTALASMPTGPDYQFHAEYGGNGKIYVMGGQNDGTLNRIYDIATNTWSAGAPVPECVNDHGHVYYNGKVYVIGGWACGAPSSAVYAYDVASNTWSAPL